MENNRYPITGTVVEILALKQYSAFFKKQEFMIRFSDTEVTGKMTDRKIKLATINENCEVLGDVRVNDLVDIKFYIDGNDWVKDGKTTHYDSLIAYEIIVINSPSRTTTEDKNAVIGKNGLEYVAKEASVEDLIRAGAYNTGEDDVLNKAGYKDTKKTEPVPAKVDEFDDLPF